MLYEKNKEKQLAVELFRKPTSEYRGTPFWAWNCRLEKDELLRQIDILKEMGFGGFHMHVRSGMGTEYLGDEFMDLIKSCTDKAERENMLAWLYDEDRWPSGFAGGLVTKDPEYRIRYLLFTPDPYESVPANDKLHPNEQNVMSRSGDHSSLIARFCVELDENGCLSSYRRLADGEEISERESGTVWYAYVESPKLNPRYNGYTYANLLDKPTIDRFIEVTHERYYKTVGDRFGTVVPAIFTDEPQTTMKQTLPFAESKKDVALPWTDDIEDSFREKYGISLTDSIPELIWELPEGISRARYCYHDHVCDRFASAFADNLGDWCGKHGIMLTGHMMKEPTLTSQTQAVGECMRSLRSFQLPGIDMLADRMEFTTAKQAASVAHQYGREGVMSELYGVTDWNYDFRSHKLHGDWQAALGVSVRVPHLSWVSMEGEAKRDYPASLNYQSSWYGKYSYVEDHFARVNTAMTRGKPVIKIGVIHPVESLWIHWGPSSQTEAARDRLDSAFDKVTSWLLYGSLDFDYISESLLPELCPVAGNPLKVGKMEYDAIVVPGCETLRSTTVERLDAFRKAGGKLVFMGKAPEYMDAVPSARPAELWAASVRSEFTRSSLLDALEDVRTVEIRGTSGSLTGNLFSAMRQDGDTRWLFVVHADHPYNKDISRQQEITISVSGSYTAELYDTTAGTVKPLAYSHKNGKTVIPAKMWYHDSLLIRLLPAGEDAYAVVNTPKPAAEVRHPQILIRDAAVSVDEPNVLLLDLCRYALDGEPLSELPEEILRVDTLTRKKLGWPVLGGSANQPWCIPEEPIEHRLRTEYTFDSEIPIPGAKLALELAEDTLIKLNGTPIESKITGWYTDRSVKTVDLPDIPAGRSVIELDAPFGKRTAAERIYLLGDFGVSVDGSLTKITARPDRIGFGALRDKGFPFFGGKITYSFDVCTSLDSLEIRIPRYRAQVYEVSLDGGKPVTCAYAPYSTVFKGTAPGTHKVDVTLYLSRYNSFGRIHCADRAVSYPSPPVWRTSGDAWSYEYNLCEEGILSAPEIREFEI
ncbi:MAG: hypothetical protein J5592_09410 [Clostridia bacterium]|nr:hypothetical protein [Clostridia bacterium]